MTVHRSLRSRLVVVSQEPFLFEVTLGSAPAETGTIIGRPFTVSRVGVGDRMRVPRVLQAPEG